MRKMTFQISTVDGPREAEGYRVWLHVGDGPLVAFVLQLRGDDPCVLTHYASGYKLYDMANDMLARKVWRGDLSPTGLGTWRWMAQNYVQRIVEAKGAEVVRAKLDAVPVINRV